MVFDSINELCHPKCDGAITALADRSQRERREIAARIGDFCYHVNIVYMLANHLPLLKLARLPSRVGMGSVDEARAHTVLAGGGLDGFLEVCEEARARRERKGVEVFARGTFRGRVMFVAFTDPNDLLSYAIPTWFACGYAAKDAHFVNVISSVAKPAWFEVFVSPLTAHTAYPDDDRVLSIIVCGLQAPADESPLSCRAR